MVGGGANVRPMIGVNAPRIVTAITAVISPTIGRITAVNISAAIGRIVATITVVSASVAVRIVVVIIIAAVCIGRIAAVGVLAAT